MPGKTTSRKSTTRPGAGGRASAATRSSARPGTSATSAHAEGGLARIDGKDVKLSHLDKVLYPEAGFTKAQVIDYYARIAPVLLPHVRGRPLTLKRYPDGVEGEFFYEKMCPSHRPAWVATTKVVSTGGKRPFVQYCVIEDAATLVWGRQPRIAGTCTRSCPPVTTSCART